MLNPPTETLKFSVPLSLRFVGYNYKSIFISLLVNGFCYKGRVSSKPDYSNFLLSFSPEK